MKRVFTLLKWSGGILFCLALLGVDLWSKQWALTHLPLLGGISTYPFGGVGVLDASPWMTISLNLLTNQGTAWGLLAEWPKVLLIARSLIVFVLVGMLFTKRISPAWRLPLGLVIVGAASNIFDVVRFGAVIDFILVRFGSWSFPCFNLADSVICVGIALLFIASWRES